MTTKKKKSEFKIALEAVSDLFNDQLKLFNFSDKFEKSTYGLNIRTWKRNYDWKIDTIDIRYRGAESYILLNLGVLLPITNNNSIYFDTFAGIGILTPHIPISFAELRSKWYAKTIYNILKNKLFWFDKYRTPQDCINDFNNTERNGFIKKDVLENARQNLLKNDTKTT
jgi:hypothetical protein